MEQLPNQLEVNIHKKLSEFQLNVDFIAEKGCLGILGPSGCGKSMTLKSIAGIVKPDNGKILLRNENMSHEYLYNSETNINLKPQKRKVGYLFQNYALFPNMTVEQNIMVGLKGNGKSKNLKQQEKELLRFFKIEELHNRYPAQLSGGQQQRVALARIFAYEPKIILLDEPFSAMDTFLREGLRLELLQVLKEYHGISVLVTHDRDEAYQMCDHVILMDKGEIITSGETKEVFRNPQTVEAAKLTGCKNISRIEKIGTHQVKALDWNNLILNVEEEVDNQITHIGIRAHNFDAVLENDNIGNYVNLIEVKNANVSEMPFEWYVTLENGIWWKQEKDINRKSVLIPQFISVDPKAILLLKN